LSSLSQAAPLHGHSVLAHHFEDLSQQKTASTFGMWVFLVTEIMFFGGLFLAYTIYRELHYQAFVYASHHLDLALGAVNTAVLICSSLTMAMAVHAAALGKRSQIVLFLLLTIALGGVFLGIKFVEYRDKFHAHLVPGPHFSAAELKGHEGGPLPADEARHAQVFYSLYFAMTGLHATHMIVGIPILATMAWRAHRRRFTPAYYTPVEITGLYWHFVDIVWIFLFPLLYLIGRHH
jgi:cytochrome c oxidase subunit III